jgi:uncharacterized protein YejL (UPF0352 family)
MIGAKETCKLQEHRYRLLDELLKVLESHTSKNGNSGLVICAVLCNIVKANGMRVNVTIL